MVSVGLGVAGYVLFFMLGLMETAGAGQQLRAVWPSLNSMCVMLLWYGLYFGVLGRDCAEVAAARMVREMHPPCSFSLPKGCLNTTFVSSIPMAYLGLPPSLPTLPTSLHCTQTAWCKSCSLHVIQAGLKHFSWSTNLQHASPSYQPALQSRAHGWPQETHTSGTEASTA